MKYLTVKEIPYKALHQMRPNPVLRWVAAPPMTAAQNYHIAKKRCVLLVHVGQQDRIGACVSCQQLQTVDLSQTCVIEILGSTFAFCSQLQQPSLPRNLRIIEQEAFLKCTSLQEVCVPPSLLPPNAKDQWSEDFQEAIL